MGGYTHQELENVSRDVEQHLLDFGIEADVVAVHPGPVVTRFELQLAAGVKVSKLTAFLKIWHVLYRLFLFVLLKSFQEKPW